MSFLGYCIDFFSHMHTYTLVDTLSHTTHASSHIKEALVQFLSSNALHARALLISVY